MVQYMSEKIDLQLKDIQETLLLPLWGRAVEQNKKKPLLIDEEAIKILNTLNYDFTTITKNISEISQLGWVARAIKFDYAINQFLEKHPDGTVVNIGCGFDTTYERVDNGTVLWYDLDLPEVIKLREKLIQEYSRRKHIASSFLDNDWLDQLTIKDNILFCSAGVLYYFDEEIIKDFINRLANKFPHSEIIFDATTNIKMANKLILYSDYLNNYGNIDVNWELNFDLTINKHVSANVGTQLIFDDDVKHKEDINNDGTLDILGPKIQLKQLLGVGFSYNF